MTKELLEKYLNNRCTSKEVNEVIHWMKQQSFYNQSKELGRKDWQKYNEEDGLVSDEKLDILLDKIHHKLNIEEPCGLHMKSNRIINRIAKVAAIFMIPVLGFLFYTISENDKLNNQVAAVYVDSLEVIAPVGSRAIVELSDGTVVHLNYGSRMKYPKNFSGEMRSVVLSGEGYFDVAHNPDKPFVVHTGLIDVKALGTVFNVNAYPGNNYIATSLVEGEILLEKQLPGKNSEQLGSLKPEQHVNYNYKTKKLTCNIGNIDKYIGWKDGKLVFDNESIEQVTQRLSRMFNVDIQVDNDVKQYRYTVTFIDEPLFQILELLTVATPIKYEALTRTKNPDGTFSKQKIIIKKNN